MSLADIETKVKQLVDKCQHLQAENNRLKDRCQHLEAKSTLAVSHIEQILGRLKTIEESNHE